MWAEKCFEIQIFYRQIILKRLRCQDISVPTLGISKDNFQQVNFSYLQGTFQMAGNSFRMYWMLLLRVASLTNQHHLDLGRLCPCSKNKILYLFSELMLFPREAANWIFLRTMENGVKQLMGVARGSSFSGKAWECEFMR